MYLVLINTSNCQFKLHFHTISLDLNLLFGISISTFVSIRAIKRKFRHWLMKFCDLINNILKII